MNVLKEMKLLLRVQNQTWKERGRVVYFFHQNFVCIDFSNMYRYDLDYNLV